MFKCVKCGIKWGVSKKNDSCDCPICGGKGIHHVMVGYRKFDGVTVINNLLFDCDKYDGRARLDFLENGIKRIKRMEKNSYCVIVW